MSTALTAGMKHRRGVVEIRMAILESVKNLHFTRSATAALMGLLYKRANAIMDELERNKLISAPNRDLFLTPKGQSILTRYNKLVKDLNIGTIG